MTRQEIEEYLKSIEQKIDLLRSQHSYDDWADFHAIFMKRAPRYLEWLIGYIRKLHGYVEHLEKAAAANADPATALSQSAGVPSMRVVKSQPKIEPPQRTDDLPKSTMGDAFDLEGYECER